MPEFAIQRLSQLLGILVWLVAGDQRIEGQVPGDDGIAGWLRIDVARHVFG